MHLKVLHVPFTFAPGPIGGTEVYVESLAQELRANDIESIIAAPSSNGTDELYTHNDLQVHRYRTAQRSRNLLREIYGAGDATAASAFAQILLREKPDVVHLHAFTRAVSILLLRAAKKNGIPTFFTYHTPTVSCQRGTLILRGETICDGILEVGRCTDCLLRKEGLPRWVSKSLSHVPSLFAKVLEQANLGGGLWTALRMAELIRESHNAFRSLMTEVDEVIALREWVRVLLIQNGVPQSKIKLLGHGLAGTAGKSEHLIDVAKSPLRVAFLGRADKVKGIDLLIKAVRAAPDLDIELDLYGITQNSGDQTYQISLEKLAARDPRIRFLSPVPHEKIVSLLSNYHLLAVPSRWMETGPLVVLEAFAAGIPVIGSNLGGISEWVTHEQNGLLVNFEDISGWTAALGRCANDRQLLARLRKSVKQPRTMADVASEMAQLYRKHTKRKADFQRGATTGRESQYFP